MTDQKERAARFKALHVKGNSLILYNIWNAGGARALQEAGAEAVATGSWSMAAAHGFEDGEAIPLDFVLQIVERIAVSADLPLILDFEGGYAFAPHLVAANVRRVIQAGAIGINLKDWVISGEGLYSVADQARRSKAVRQMANQEGIDLFINARTDLFLGSDSSHHAGFVAKAIERQAAYKEAGADGFFVPGLTDLPLIKTVLDATSLPVDVMMFGDLASVRNVAAMGVARASFGPGPHIAAMSNLKASFAAMD